MSVYEQADPRMAGERQARRRAGPWPRSATLEQCEEAAALAIREARRTGDIAFRFARLTRLRDPGDVALRQQWDRLDSRRLYAISIAEERCGLLHCMKFESAGSA